MKKSPNDIDLLSIFKHGIESNELFSQQHRLLIACSGGLDSVVLVHLLHHLNYTITLLHCNFHLRGDESIRDEAFVQQMASSMNIDCIIKHFDTKEAMKQHKKGVQETARILRYEWFQEQLEYFTSTGDRPLLLTAHHLDDQCETIAFNFFRGTGIAGLTGMKLKEGNVVRPLLNVFKEQISAYAHHHSIKWVEDSSNKETDYSRNMIRNEVFPSVEKILPSYRQNLIDNSKRLNEIALLYQQQISLIKKKLIEKKGDAWAIPVKKLMAASPLDTIMYELFSAYGFGAHQIDELKKILTAETGKYIESASHRVLKNRDWLLIDSVGAYPSSQYVIEEHDQEISFTDHSITISKLTSYKEPSSSMNEAWLDASLIKFPLVLRPWKKGDYFYPLGMKKKKKISKFLIDQKLSLTEKEHQFVIESNKKIIWVVGRRIDDRVKILPSTKNILKLTFK